MRITSIILTLAWGVVFETTLSPYAGFYFVPTIIAGFIFIFFPVVLPLFSAAIAFLAGVLSIILFSYILLRHLPSANFLYHILLYFFLFISVIYLINAQKKK